MEFLDQSEIDALLASDGESEAPEPPPAPKSEGLRPAPELADRYRLVADGGQLERILPIRVPVRVRLADRRMDVGQLLELTIGTIIEFDRSAEAELDLVANNVPIGTGNAVKCGENFGLRVARIQPQIERLLAAGLIR